MSQLNNEQQPNQVSQEYYIMGITDGSNYKKIQFANSDYLAGYKHGLFSILEASIDDMSLALSQVELPF